MVSADGPGTRRRRGGLVWVAGRVCTRLQVFQARWRAVAVATLWMVSVGGAVEVGPGPEATALPALRPLLGAIVATPGRPRRLRVLRLGWLWCLVCQITTGGLPLPPRFVPEPWPEMPVAVLVVTFHQNALEYNGI